MSQIKAGALLAYISLGASNVAGILLTPLMLRSFETEEYGLYAMLGALAGYIGLLDLGLGPTTLRYLARYRAENDQEGGARFFSLCLLASMGLATLIIPVSGLVYSCWLPGVVQSGFGWEWFDAASWMFWLLICNVGVHLVSTVFMNANLAYERFVWAKSVGLARIVVRVTLVLLALELELGPVAIVAIDTTLNALVGLANGCYAFRCVGLYLRKPRLEADAVLDVFRYSGFALLAFGANQIYWHSGQIILGAVATAAEVVVFALSAQFAQYLMMFSSVISGVLLPRVTTIVVGGADSRALTTLFIRTGRFQIAIIGLILGGFVVVGEEFVLLWAGPEFGTVWMTSLCMMLPLVVPLCETVGIKIIEAQNRQGFRSTMLSIVAIGSVGISIPMARRWGAWGPAGATAMALILGNAVMMNWYYGRYLGIDLLRLVRGLAQGMVVSIGVSLTVGLLALATWSSNSWAGLGLKIAVFATVYLMSLWVFGLNVGEKKEICGFIGRCLGRSADESRSLTKG
jgi:O-antigen/teichoic acid export membrane protein